MNARLEAQTQRRLARPVPPLKISQDADGWILLEYENEWVSIPPDGLRRPYGPDLPTPTRPQNVTIGRWLKGTAS